MGHHAMLFIERKTQPFITYSPFSFYTSLLCERITWVGFMIKRVRQGQINGVIIVMKRYPISSSIQFNVSRLYQSKFVCYPFFAINYVSDIVIIIITIYH